MEKRREGGVETDRSAHSPPRNKGGSRVARYKTCTQRRKEDQTLSIGSEEGEDEGAGRSLGAGGEVVLQGTEEEVGEGGAGKQIRPRLAQTPSVGSTRGRRKGILFTPQQSPSRTNGQRSSFAPETRGKRKERDSFLVFALPPFFLASNLDHLLYLLTRENEVINPFILSRSRPLPSFSHLIWAPTYTCSYMLYPLHAI